MSAVGERIRWAKSMRFRALAALVAAVGLVAGIVWVDGRGSGPPAAQGELVTVERGEVAVTVGGIGHIDTLGSAARVAVPASTASGTGSAGAGAGASPGGAGSSSSSAAGAAGGGSGGGSGAQAPGDAVFPTATGRVRRLLVGVGDHVVADQPVAILSDGGAAAGNLAQARNDLAGARLELAQKRVQDPARGLPPTSAELSAGSQAIRAAREKLRRTVGPALPADVAAARLELAKAVADMRGARDGAPDAVAAAELGVAAARQKLLILTGAPDPVDVAAARLELAKATVDQETLLLPAAADPAAVAAADAAVAAAQQRLSVAQASGVAADVASAQAELARVASDRAALNSASAPVTDSARAAAALAVDVARRRLAQVFAPPAATVTAARQELAQTQADLAGLRASRGQPGIAAAQAAVTAARRKLTQTLGPPTSDIVAAARSDLRRARADLAVLGQRGAPASATDLALGRLKVDLASERASLAGVQARDLTVRAGATGTVTSVLAVRDAPIDPTTPLLRVQDLSHLVVTLDLSEFDVGRIRVGALARVNVDALEGRQFGGRVRDVALSGADNGGVVSFPVIIALHSNGRLRTGMSVSARIVVRRRRDVVRVPLDAIVERGGGPTVTVADRSGALQRRTVKLGLTGGQFVEVRSGLRAGERVMVPLGGE